MQKKFELPKNPNGCPPLFLAPMEGVGDRAFRKAMSSIGGFNEAVTEFIRVPTNAHVKSLAKVYEHDETTPIPLAAQIMGQDPGLMAEMTFELESKGAKRVDLNCGCPSNTVTGKGAGSSLLKTPELLHKIAKSMVTSVSIPVTLKMRSGYENTSLFKENLLAAEESGVKFITLHPRTKVDGYHAPANWELISEAKSILKIPLIGNGDILNVQDALKMIEMTSCDGLMIGRGSVINPFIFKEIQAYYSKETFKVTFEDLEKYLSVFIKELPFEMLERGKVNKMKQLMGFLFKKNETLIQKRQEMLTGGHKTFQEFFDFSLALLKSGF